MCTGLGEKKKSSYCSIINSIAQGKEISSIISNSTCYPYSLLFLVETEIKISFNGRQLLLFSPPFSPLEISTCM